MNNRKKEINVAKASMIMHQVELKQKEAEENEKGRISEQYEVTGECIGCFEFSEDYYWDEMIMKDGMTAMLVKGNNLYWAERQSDSVADGIFHEVA